MAVVNVKSTQVSNFDAQPRILTPPWIERDTEKVAIGIVLCGASDSNASVYRVGFVPSGACISTLAVMNDANTSGTSYKFGVANNTQDGGGLPVANSDLIFASAVSMASARTTLAGVLSPSILNAGGLAANLNLRIWELLGFTSDPDKLYHLIMTAVAAGSAGGSVAVKYSYLR